MENVLEKFIIEYLDGVYIKELIEAPWLVIEKPRKEKFKIKAKIKKIKGKVRISKSNQD